MTPPRLQLDETPDADELSAELLRFIDALAEAQARRDYARAYPQQDSLP